MSHSFKDKVAIITGSSRGIGKAVALALANEGAKVVINARSQDKLQITDTEFKNMGYDSLAIAGDVSNFTFCERLVKETLGKYGRIDILINNAGLSTEGKIEDTNPAVFQTAVDVNILGVIYPTKAAIASLKKTKGSIIITGSIAGFMGLPEFSAYSATKMSLTAIAQSLTIELAGTGVHVGLNYVGFAQNDETKTYINKDGEVDQMPIRADFKRMPMDKIAQIFLKGIEKRKRRQILSGLGSMTSLVSRFIPGLFERIMIKRYLKQQQAN